MQYQSEEQLVAASRRGDRQAYSELAQRHARRVFAVCLGMLGHVQDAEDAMQDALQKGLTEIHHLRNDASFPGWLVRVAQNVCREYWRKQQRQQKVIAQYLPLKSTPEIDTDLEDALAQLPEKYRLPLMLYYFDSQDTRTIAGLLNLSTAGVLTRLTRARWALRKLLEKSGTTP